MAEELEFVDGLLVKAPHERAPSFVKASISIKVEALRKWLDGKNDEWINIDVKESKGGKWYAAVSNFKPKKKDDDKPKSRPAKDENGDDIPF